MSKQFKPIPKFASEDEEREFWATHSSADYIDWSKAEVIREKWCVSKFETHGEYRRNTAPLPDMIRRLQGSC